MDSGCPVVLVILDGFGHTQTKKYNVIAHAYMPHMKSWREKYPHTYLHASGSYVGLLPDAIGNSQVGHMTIGAGRIVPQAAVKIHTAIADGTLQHNQALLRALDTVKKHGGALHIMGLLSDAGVHATMEFMTSCIAIACKNQVRKVIVHPFLDGRDVVPRSAVHYLQMLTNIMEQYPNVVLGSLHGRYYAMDRDHNWDRIEQSYRVLTESVPSSFSDWKSVIVHYYTKNITDEFIPPTQLSPDAIITSGDGILCTNYRPDRARELTACFVMRDQVPFSTKDVALSAYITPINYGASEHTTVLLADAAVSHTLKKVLSAHHKTMISVAETEKYAHVTYFFDGQQEASVPGETRIMVPSIIAKNYIEQPCMSAPAITQAVLQSLKTSPADFYLINYANADMVGHSGDFGATVKAVECLDTQLGALYAQVVENMGGTLIITADHGKAELMYDELAQQPYTGHTNNQVPFMVVSPQKIDVPLPTQLSEVAPWILRSMNIAVPDEMKK